jgi:hypothetical protein
MALESEFHTQLETRIIEWCQTFNHYPLLNFRLPTGKIADVIYITRNNEITIIEVKTTLYDYVAEQAIQKYARYCNYFYLAAPIREAEQFAVTYPVLSWKRATFQAGVLAIGDRTVATLRQPTRAELTSSTTEYLAASLREKLRFTANYRL